MVAKSIQLKAQELYDKVKETDGVSVVCIIKDDKDGQVSELIIGTPQDVVALTSAVGERILKESLGVSVKDEIAKLRRGATDNLEEEDKPDDEKKKITYH